VSTETLDETIDRVAAWLTHAPANPLLVERIVGRLAPSEATGVDWWKAAIAVVAVATATLVISMVGPRLDRNQIAAPPVASASTSNDAAVIQAAAPPAARGATDAVVSQPASTGSRPRQLRLNDDGAMEPLATPPRLALNALATEALTVTPVDVAPLDVANLSLEDEASHEPKE